MSPVDWKRYPPKPVWAAMREKALEHARHRCQGCGAEDLEDGTNRTRLTAHHPDRDPSNHLARLTILCAACHLAVESIARARQQRLADAERGRDQLTLGEDA